MAVSGRIVQSTMQTMAAARDRDTAAVDCTEPGVHIVGVDSVGVDIVGVDIVADAVDFDSAGDEE